MRAGLKGGKPGAEWPIISQEWGFRAAISLATLRRGADVAPNAQGLGETLVEIQRAFDIRTGMRLSALTSGVFSRKLPVSRPARSRRGGHRGFGPIRWG